jgi:glucose-like phosphotransferase system IIB component
MAGFDEVATQLIEGLGGKDNIKHLEPCTTRIRVEVHDEGPVDEAALKSTGAHGIMHRGKVFQIVMGLQSDNIEQVMRRQMEAG